MKDSLSYDGTGHLQGRGTPPCIVMVATWYIQGKKGILGKYVNESGGQVGADHGISRAH